jgi:hypothetical protein
MAKTIFVTKPFVLSRGGIATGVPDTSLTFPTVGEYQIQPDAAQHAYVNGGADGSIETFAQTQTRVTAAETAAAAAHTAATAERVRVMALLYTITPGTGALGYTGNAATRAP